MNIGKQNGFSLVELALVLIIFGFTTSLVLLALGSYTKQARITKTTEAINKSSAVLVSFKGNSGRLPCPAPLNLAPGAAGFGEEMTVFDNSNTRRGRNDIDLDGINDDYVFGAIPTETIKNDPTLRLLSTEDLNFATSDGLDGWSNKLVYVVSRHLCDTAHPLYANPQGVLDVITEATCTSVIDGSDVPQSVLPGSCDGDDRRYAQFVIMSMGENARGAWTEGGIPVENCIDGTVTILNPGDPGFGGIAGNTDWFNGFPSDRKNCKYDQPDIGSARNGEFFFGLTSLADDRTYYDDFIKFYYEDNFQVFSSASSLAATAPDGTTFEISRMQNVNTGDIGIGLQNPEEILHINGDLQAFDIEADQFCTDTGSATPCMPPETLTTPGISCAPGEAITSIELNNVNCADPYAGLDFTCPLTNERLNWIYSDGSFTCCDVSVSPIVCTDY